MAKNQIKIDPGRTLIVLEGGPKAGQWFYLDDWQKSVAEAQSMAEWAHHVPALLQYRSTECKADHPSARGPSAEPITGQVWAHVSPTESETST